MELCSWEVAGKNDPKTCWLRGKSDMMGRWWDRNAMLYIYIYVYLYNVMLWSPFSYCLNISKLDDWTKPTAIESKHVTYIGLVQTGVTISTSKFHPYFHPFCPQLFVKKTPRPWRRCCSCGALPPHILQHIPSHSHSCGRLVGTSRLNVTSTKFCTSLHFIAHTVPGIARGDAARFGTIALKVLPKQTVRWLMIVRKLCAIGGLIPSGNSKQT